MTELTRVYSVVRPESLNVLHSQYLSLECFVTPLLFPLVTVCPYQICAGEQICIMYKIHGLKVGTVTYGMVDGYHTQCVFIVTSLIVKVMGTSIILQCCLRTLSDKVHTKRDFRKENAACFSIIEDPLPPSELDVPLFLIDINNMPHYTVTLHALHNLSFSFTITYNRSLIYSLAGLFGSAPRS